VCAAVKVHLPGTKDKQLNAEDAVGTDSPQRAFDNSKNPVARFEGLGSIFRDR